MSGDESVTLALEQLRGSVDTGFAKLDGKLNVALQRTDTVEREVARLDSRLTDLEKRVWRYSLAAAVIGAGGGAGAWQLLGQ